MDCSKAPLSSTVSWSLLKFTAIQSVMLSSHILCWHLLLLHSIFPSIRVFSNESALCTKWPKYWSFTSVLSMNIQGWFPLGLTGLISVLSSDELRNTVPHPLESSVWYFCGTAAPPSPGNPRCLSLYWSLVFWDLWRSLFCLTPSFY